MKSKKMNVKGFSLVELIVVIATFSIIMGGALSLMQPSRKMFNRSYTNEGMVSGAAQVHGFLEESLRYSAAVDVEDHLPTAAEMKAFANQAFGGRLEFANATADPTAYKGEFYVLHIDNKADSTGNTGQIYKTTYSVETGGYVDLSDKTESGKKTYWVKYKDPKIVDKGTTLCLNQSIFNELNFTVSLGVFDAKANNSGDATYYTLQKNADYYAYNTDTGGTLKPVGVNNFAFTVTAFPRRIPNTEYSKFSSLVTSQDNTRFDVSGTPAFYNASNYSSGIPLDNLQSSAKVNGSFAPEYIVYATENVTDAADHDKYKVVLDSDKPSYTNRTFDASALASCFKCCDAFKGEPVAAPDDIYIMYAYFDSKLTS